MSIFCFAETMSSRPVTEAPEHEELFDVYMELQNDPPAVCAPKRPRTGLPAVADMPWDPIDPKLPGCLDTKAMFTWARSKEILWAKPLEQLLPGYVPPWREPRPAVHSCVRTGYCSGANAWTSWSAPSFGRRPTTRCDRLPVACSDAKRARRGI